MVDNVNITNDEIHVVARFADGNVASVFAQLPEAIKAGNSEVISALKELRTKFENKNNNDANNQKNIISSIREQIEAINKSEKETKKELKQNFDNSIQSQKKEFRSLTKSNTHNSRQVHDGITQFKNQMHTDMASLTIGLNKFFGVLQTGFTIIQKGFDFFRQPANSMANIGLGGIENPMIYQAEARSSMGDLFDNRYLEVLKNNTQMVMSMKAIGMDFNEAFFKNLKLDRAMKDATNEQQMAILKSQAQYLKDTRNQTELQTFDFNNKLAQSANLLMALSKATGKSVDLLTEEIKIKEKNSREEVFKKDFSGIANLMTSMDFPQELKDYIMSGGTEINEKTMGLLSVPGVKELSEMLMNLANDGIDVTDKNVTDVVKQINKIYDDNKEETQLLRNIVGQIVKSTPGQGGDFYRNMYQGSGILRQFDPNAMANQNSMQFQVNQMSSKLSEKWNEIIQKFSGSLSQLSDSILKENGPLDALTQSICTLIDKLVQDGTVKNVIDEILKLITDLSEKIKEFDAEKIKQYINDFVDGIKNTIDWVKRLGIAFLAFRTVQFISDVGSAGSALLSLGTRIFGLGKTASMVAGAVAAVGYGLAYGANKIGEETDKKRWSKYDQLKDRVNRGIATPEEIKEMVENTGFSILGYNFKSDEEIAKDVAFYTKINQKNKENKEILAQQKQNQTNPIEEPPVVNIKQELENEKLKIEDNSIEATDDKLDYQFFKSILERSTREIVDAIGQNHQYMFNPNNV